MIDFNNVPQEMKDAQEKYNAARKRWLKAQDQAFLWKKELTSAEADFRDVERWYGTVTMRWDPDTNTMAPASDPRLEEIRQ